MRRQWKGFLAGLLTAVLVSAVVTPALGALAAKTIQVYTGVNVYVDDVKVNPKDANGNPVEVFVYNGTTYLPIRAIGEALGKPVQWEGKTNSAYVGKHQGDKPAVWLKDLNYFTGARFNTKSTLRDNLGNEWTDVIFNYTGGVNFNLSKYDNTYKLNGQYSKISGTLFQAYDYRSFSQDYNEATLKIYGDGNLLYSATMNGGIEPINFAADLEGVLELEVYFESRYAAIGDCGLWT